MGDRVSDRRPVRRRSTAIAARPREGGRHAGLWWSSKTAPLGDPKRGKGKRGGARAIYLDVPEAGIIFFLDIYGKDEKDDLTSGEKKALKVLVKVYRREVLPGARKGRPRRRGES